MLLHEGMKNKLIISIFFLYGGMLWAQEKGAAIIPSDTVLTNYLTEAKAYAALYTGKTETPYETRFTNHPYFETDRYVSGTLCFNRLVYRDVMMRIDLFRDEITVVSPYIPYRIVLNNEKFDYAVLNGSTIIKSKEGKESKEKFLVLLHDGTYPVVRKHQLNIMEEISSSERTITRYFKVKLQYAVYIDGIPYPVKNKNAILKLFADRKKELNEYAKLHKLNFKKQTELSIIALVNHYENLTSQKHADETDLRR